MTAPDKPQLTFDELCDLGAAEYYEPEPRPREHDIEKQGLTATEKNTITTVQPDGRYL